MTPALTTFYPADLILPNVVIGSNFPLLSWIRNYCKNVCIGKFRRWGVRSAPIIPTNDFYTLPLGRAIALTFCHPAIGNSILRVIFFCAKKQMRRVYARWVIAAVQNEGADRNGAKRQQPSHPVRDYLSATNRDAAVCYFPVKIDAVAKPIPTPRGGGFVDFGPESIGSSWRIHGSIMTYGVHCE